MPQTMNRLVAKYRTFTAAQLVQASELINQMADDMGNEDYRDRHAKLLEAEQARRTESVTAVDLKRAHEQALREDEERWADAQLDGYNEDDAAAVRDLALRVRRNYRLSREPGRELMSRYSRWCSNAQRELREEHGFEVDNLYGVWSIETVESGDDYC